MELQIFCHILAGLIFFGACSLALANPVPQAADSFDSLDGIQNDDDYEYSDDESAPNSHTRSTTAGPMSGIIPFFKETDINVSTIVGKNVTLACAAQNVSDGNVIMWYKNNDLLTTGKEVLKSEYDIDRKNFALIIVNATEANEGDYYCEVQPQKIRQHITLVVSDQALEAIIPESSKSSQESVYFKSTCSLLMSVIGIFLFLRI